MPKTKKNKSENKTDNTSTQIASTNDEQGPVYVGSKQEIILKLHCKPGAKKSSITSMDDDAVGVQISAPPVDGEANKELIRYLAEVLKLRKSDLSLEKGPRSKLKTVVITKDISLTEVLNALKTACQ